MSNYTRDDDHEDMDDIEGMDDPFGGTPVHGRGRSIVMVIGRTVVCGPILAFAFVACGGQGTSSDPALQAPAVRGTITYRERIALTPGTVVVVQLLDVSRADAPGIVVGEQRIDSPGQVPIRFEIRYDPARIDPQRPYAISARIFRGGRALFIADTPYYVITRGNPSRVEMVLRPVL